MRRFVLLLTVMAVTLVVSSGVALAVNKVGTNGPDTLRGTNGADNLLGHGGNDVLYALGGNKNLVGGPGNDGVEGGLGSDTLLGGSGNDFADGGPGSDNISGGEGNDFVVDGERRGSAGATDILTGGDGNDVLDAAGKPAGRGFLTCGRGFDRVLADTEDVVAPDCEKVAVGPAAVRELQQQLEDSGYFDRLIEGLAPFPPGS
jgi:Ca2+-binding RTX toxin-like protein